MGGCLSLRLEKMIFRQFSLQARPPKDRVNQQLSCLVYAESPCGRLNMRTAQERTIGPVKILVVGGGGREHALAWKLQQSPQVDAIFCAPGNAGTEELGENVPLLPNDSRGLRKFARENQIDLTVVGPDDPLAAGLVDEFHEDKLRIFGPSKAAARLESSKVFAKQLMRGAGVPTAMAGVFDDSRKACRFAEKLHYPVVIKADGLAAGKGVVIAPDAGERDGSDLRYDRSTAFRRGRRADLDRGISARAGNARSTCWSMASAINCWAQPAITSA